MHNLRSDRFITTESSGEIILYPNQFMLLSTKEIIEVPNNIMGFCCIRSTIARSGILCPPTIIDCGFHGALTIEIYNTTKRPILLREGDRFLHVVFDYVNTPSSTPYCGKYQGQSIVTPPKQSIV
jgi:dCTP deaminase